MLKLELRALKARRQALVQGLLDDTGTSEGNEGIGLCQADVGLHGKACRDPARGGIGEHGDIEQPCVTMATDGTRGLGHLHEGGRPLLHARAARHGEAHDGQAPLGCQLEEATDLLAHDATHRTHHELAVHHEDGAAITADGRRTANDALGFR